MSLPDSTTVLIVGGGPVGITTALSLLHHGFRDFVIVDSILQGENTSRAIVVHGATLEALDTFECGGDIVSQGRPISGQQMMTRSSFLMRPDFTLLKRYTRHSYAILIPQILTEHILEKKLASLGVSVHRPLKVVDVKRNSKNAQLTDVTFEDGRVVVARYVVGADGARSLIRTIAGVNFTDPISGMAENMTNIAQTVLADVTFDAPYGVDNFETTLTPTAMFLCAPLPSSFNDYLATKGHPPISDPLFRIGCAVPLEDGDIPHSPQKEYLQNLVDRFGPFNLSSDPSINPDSKSIRIKDVVWSTRFRSHSAIADTCFTRLGSSSGQQGGGVILLVGDAAHIHSPAGGQGMNLGIRDAVSLGRALTKHIHAAETKPLSEADVILKDFAVERRERALGVIKLTKWLVSAMGTKYRERLYWWLPISTATVRDWGMWLAGFIPAIQQKIAWEMSGLGRR